jgi:SIR2-like domain/TIR domain
VQGVEASGSHEAGDNLSAAGPAGLPLKIFINYRHEDMPGTAWALYLKLAGPFGAENVFFDNGTLRPGMRWLEEVKSHLASGGVLIALIGTKWMSSLTARRQRGGDDYVAMEIDLALRSPAATVIPALVDDAVPPKANELPPSLRALPDCHAERLRHTHLADDIERLIGRLSEIRAGAPGIAAEHEPGRPRAPQSPSGQIDKAAAVAADDETTSRAATTAAAQDVLPADDGHYQMVTDEADNLIVFLGAGVNADDHEGTWEQGSATLPDDRDLARYLAGKVRLNSELRDLAEVAQYVREIRGEPNVYRWVKQVLVTDSEPGPIHKYLANFPKRLAELGLEKRYPMIVTSKYDTALERAFREAGEPFDVAVYMSPGTDNMRRFVHLPWGQADPEPIVKPNVYAGFPFVAEDGKLTQTVIVRINGVVEDPSVGYGWKSNYVITEDHYIDYMGGRLAEEVVPGQILAKLREASCLFLGYTMADWRLRVFLRWIWRGDKFGLATHWAVARDPDVLERRFWQRMGVSLYRSRLIDYLQGFDTFLDDHRDELT